MVVVRKQKIENPLLMKVNENPYGKPLLKTLNEKLYEKRLQY